MHPAGGAENELDVGTFMKCDLEMAWDTKASKEKRGFLLFVVKKKNKVEAGVRRQWRVLLYLEVDI